MFLSHSELWVLQDTFILSIIKTKQKKNKTLHSPETFRSESLQPAISQIAVNFLLLLTIFHGNLPKRCWFFSVLSCTFHFKITRGLHEVVKNEADTIQNFGTISQSVYWDGYGQDIEHFQHDKDLSSWTLVNTSLPSHSHPFINSWKLLIWY